MANEIMVASTENYPALVMKIEDFREAVMENAGDGITASDLTKVKVPSGGSLFFSVPTLEGDEAVKDLRGIIIHTQAANALWTGAFDGSKNPPNCTSEDGLVGCGEPGGECASCPFNQFGSGSDAKGNQTKGKACKNMMKVFILLEGAMLPIMIALPPSSLASFKKYRLALTQNALPLSAVITSIKLVKTKSDAGIEYSECVFKLGGKISADEKASVKAYKDAIMPMIVSAKINDMVE